MSLIRSYDALAQGLLRLFFVSLSLYSVSTKKRLSIARLHLLVPAIKAFFSTDRLASGVKFRERTVADICAHFCLGSSSSVFSLPLSLCVLASSALYNFRIGCSTPSASPRLPSLRALLLSALGVENYFLAARASSCA